MTPDGHPDRSFLRLLGLVAIAVALLAAACGGGDGDEAATTGTTATGATSDVSEQGAPVRGGSITVGLEAETNSWLPGRGNFSNPGINVALSIYDPLFRRDETGEIRPYLAESISSNAELTEWTVTLRPGVTFHDGTTFDANALKTIFDDYLRAPGSNLAGMVEGVASLDVVDDLTVVYRLTEPDSAFDGVLASAPGWPFSPTAAAAAGEDAGSKPAGTGPFMIREWRRDDRLVLERNPNYWQEGLPYLDEIVFRPIPDEDTRIASLESGDVDVIQSLRQSAVRRIREVDGVDSYEHIGNNSGSAIFNTSKPPLDDVRVRRALAYALDQEQLIEVLGGSGITPPQTQYFSQDSPWFSEKAADRWPTNRPDEAAALIEEYVHDPGRSDGKGDGDPVSISFDCPPDPSLIELSQMYQAFWSAVGVEVDLNQVEQTTHVSQAMAGDYEAKCWRVSSQDDPARIFDEAFGEGSPLNFTRFTDPVIDENVAILRTTSDTAKRKKAVEAISLVLADKVPNTFTAGTLTVLGARSEVKGLDGWVFPDGTKGEGVPGATTMWGHVWLAE